jgi:midasin (ATPase involved in ribosome maturation)
MILEGSLTVLGADQGRRCASVMLDFVDWLKAQAYIQRPLSLRDFGAWSSFISRLVSQSILPPAPAIVHGACLVLLDSFGIGNGASVLEPTVSDLKCVDMLSCMCKLTSFFLLLLIQFKGIFTAILTFFSSSIFYVNFFFLKIPLLSEPLSKLPLFLPF